MNSQQPDDAAAVSPRHRIRQAFEDFPGPVAIAGVPPVGATFRWRGQSMDDRPWALEAVYSKQGRPVLLVRTVRGSTDWQPAFETLETLRSTMAGSNPEDINITSGVDEVGTSLDIDGVPQAGARIDLADRSGVHVEWQGQKVFCVGEPSVVEGLVLRTATSADFAAYETDLPSG